MSHFRTTPRVRYHIRTYAILASLPGGSDHELVHADVRRTSHRVEDRVRDVVSVQHLADLLSRALHRLADERVRVVALQLRLDEARRHGRDADVGVERLLAERLGER